MEATRANSPLERAGKTTGGARRADRVGLRAMQACALPRNSSPPRADAGAVAGNPVSERPQASEIRKATDQLVPRALGDECILVPVGARVLDLNAVVVLNATGRCVWELLDGKHTVQEIAQALAERFAVSVEQAQEDVAAFLSELAGLGLLDRHESSH